MVDSVSDHCGSDICIVDLFTAGWMGLQQIQPFCENVWTIFDDRQLARQFRDVPTDDG